MDELVSEDELKDDEGDDSRELEGCEDVDVEESPNKLSQAQAELGPASLWSPF